MGFSRARAAPISWRAATMRRPPIVVSGRARYTYSKTQVLERRTAKRRECTPDASIEMSSPGSTSRTKVAPHRSRAAVSEATTQPEARRPSTSGR